MVTKVKTTFSALSGRYAHPWSGLGHWNVIRVMGFTSRSCLFLQTGVWKWRRIILNMQIKTIPSRWKSNKMNRPQSSILPSHPTSPGLLFRDKERTLISCLHYSSHYVLESYPCNKQAYVLITVLCSCPTPFFIGLIAPCIRIFYY